MNGRLWRIIGLWVMAFVSAAALIPPIGCGVANNGDEGDDLPRATTESEILARVVLDAGHGGFDAGASGKESGVREDELNLSVAQLLKIALETSNIEVIMTREDSGALGGTKRDDMRRRSEILNTPGVDLSVSIHMNIFSDRSVSGPMVFYMGGSAEGERLAAEVISAVCAAVDKPVRHANPGDYYVLREGYAPGIIVECGFLSNPTDEANLRDPAYQQKLAYGICSGILTYLGVE